MIDTELLFDELTKRFTYDRKRGRLHHRVGAGYVNSSKGRTGGDASIVLRPSLNRRVKVAGSLHPLFRLIVFLETGEYLADAMVSHNRNKEDTRFENIAMLTSWVPIPERRKHEAVEEMVEAFTKDQRIVKSGTAERRSGFKRAVRDRDKERTIAGVTDEYLRERIDYSSKVGLEWSHYRHLTGRVDKREREAKPGTPVIGSRDTQGYRYLTMEGFRVYLHHLVWWGEHGAFPNGQINFINGDKDDLRYENLVHIHAGASPAEKLEIYEKLKAQRLANREAKIFIPALAKTHHEQSRIEWEQPHNSDISPLDWWATERRSVEAADSFASVSPELTELYRGCALDLIEQAVSAVAFS